MPRTPGARQWRISEFVFTATGSYPNPVAEVQFSATFSGPSGRTVQVPGFWAGGQTWKVRFSPTAPGPWSYSTNCNVSDSGLCGQQGVFSAARASGDNPLYRHGGFLKVSANRRYLTHTDGTPFFWLGDTWWFCPSALVPLEGSTNPQFASMYKTLIDLRRTQGFSVVHMAFLGPMGQSRGVNSFTALAQQRTVDLDYWAQVDRYMDYANAAGILPVIGLLFHSGLDQLSLDDWQFLWRYVIARYGAYAVTWLICGEYNQNGGDPTSRVPKVMALGQYIKDTDPYHRAMTVHPWWYRGDRRQAWDQPWYDFIMVQGAHRAYPPTSLYLEAYGRSNRKPVLEGECNYEGIFGMTDGDVRGVAYSAIQAGSFGYTYGAQGLWYPTQNAEDATFKEWGPIMPWWEAMARPGAAQMGYLRALYTSLAWWKLKPVPDALRVAEGWSTQLRGLAKADGDRTFVLYLPGWLPPDMPVMLQRLPAGAAYAGTWFDPRTGAQTAVPGALAVQDGQIALPARPVRGDWVLLLRLVELSA